MGGVKARRKLDEAFLSTYKDFEVIYPFCLLSKNGKHYSRYLEDGRFEYLSIEEKHMTFQFGTRTDSLQNLVDDDKFNFKQLGNVHNIITNEDFELARRIYFSNYTKYLSSTDYYANDILQGLEQAKAHEEEEFHKKNESREKKEIITVEEQIKDYQKPKQKSADTDIYANPDSDETPF